MKTLIFDTGPIISLTVNSLLDLLEPLQKQFNGVFYITPGVQRELVERPLETKKFKFEALQVKAEIEKGTIRVINEEQIKDEAKELLDLANSCFLARGNPLRLVQLAEMEVLVAAKMMKAEGVVIDERITRSMVENAPTLQKLLDRRLHIKVKIDKDKLRQFQEKTKGIKIIRSIELVTIAYEHHLLDEFLVKVPNARKELLESVLWGMKLNGASVTRHEIEDILRLEKL